MNNEGNMVAEFKSIKKPIEIMAMMDKALRIRTGGIQFVRVTHAYEVGSNASSFFGYMWDNVSPQIGGSGIPMKENNRTTLTSLMEGYLFAIYFNEFFAQRSSRKITHY